MTSELEARIIMHFAEDIAGKLKETAIIANRERLRRAGSTGIEAQAWIIVPSTLKWSDNSSSFTRGCAISVARNRARIAGRGQQVRFSSGNLLLRRGTDIGGESEGAPLGGEARSGRTLARRRRHDEEVFTS